MFIFPFTYKGMQNQLGFAFGLLFSDRLKAGGVAKESYNSSEESLQR